MDTLLNWLFGLLKLLAYGLAIAACVAVVCLSFVIAVMEGF